ncbi:MAG: hypothetical protein COA37_12115 [Hoeflea sp.]|uniref:hypothetical protein n=1 Tax=Hoeflea sp. TaxID=1940281 RepID=UPI000C0EF888|nr:hypothetical protein [Hoeflea sp.]PHR22456.1 MAG: hypothetical protein COA37_12115 [Hoeflea sp.]
MTKLKTTTATDFAQSAHSPELKKQFETFINELVETSLSPDALAQALSGGIDDLATVLRSLPALEGRLIELGIAAVARCNPDLKVLTQNLRLPVSQTALKLVELNDAENFRALTFDADTGGRKTYTPDFVILNERTGTAHVVDAKRSVYTYDRVRLDDLQNRMKAAGLVLPDFLYKEHRRLNVREVRVVILTADNRKTDLYAGIWHLSQLDHLVEVEGAGAAIASLQAEFHSHVKANWKQACEVFAQSCHLPIALPVQPDVDLNEMETADEDDQSIEDTNVIDASGNPQLIKLGFAQPPTRH